jgi:hypothetical protein
MRLSISLDPDLYHAARARALARRTSISNEVNALLRRALSSRADAPAADDSSYLDPLTGLRVSRGHQPITPEDVRRMDDAEDLRHLEP